MSASKKIVIPRFLISLRSIRNLINREDKPAGGLSGFAQTHYLLICKDFFNQYLYSPFKFLLGIWVIVILFLSISQCKKSETKESLFKLYNTKEIVGSWKIIPSYNAKIVFDTNEKTYLQKDNEKMEIFALEDIRGMRLYYRLEDDSPFGYFLFTEKSKNIWAGILDNKVVRIVREGKSPESILE